MKVAKLAARNRTVRDLKVGAKTLYRLADQDDDDLPAIIKELAKHATKTHLRPAEAEDVIFRAIGRRRFGNHPDATLSWLGRLVTSSHRQAWHEKACTALQEQKPESAESADAVVDQVRHEYAAVPDYAEAAKEAEAARAEAKLEAEAILDGDPPALPPSTAPSEPLKYGAETDYAETEPFVDAVSELQSLRTKPIARFLDMFEPVELREVAAFLSEVASEQEKSTTEPVHEGAVSG
jgi:hypothetical protein